MGKRTGFWRTFFCTQCQADRPIEKQLRIGKYKTICAACHEAGLEYKRTGKRSVSIYSSRPLDSYVEANEDRPSIPMDIMDAYRESKLE